MNEIVGQQRAKNGLLKLYHSGRLPHALLITGKEGVGGLPFALAFAQYIFCENKQNGDSCGQCGACIKMQKLAHPDLHLTFPCIAPKPGGKASSKLFLSSFRTFFQQTPYADSFDWLQFIGAENKQGNITAEECREIIENLSLTAYEGGWKIQILWRPEYLRQEGNILLKLIEEPPEHTLIMMVAESPTQILKTIVSRSQQIVLSPLTPDEIATALERFHQITPQRALQIANLSENNYARAVNLLQHTGSDLLRPMRHWFNGIFTGNAVMINEWVEEMAKSGREQQKNFLLYVQQMLGHALRIQLIPEYVPSLLADELTFAEKLAKQHFNAEMVGVMSEALRTAIFHIERNAHSKTQLLALSIKMRYYLKGEILTTGVARERASVPLSLQHKPGQR